MRRTLLLLCFLGLFLAVPLAQAQDDVIDIEYGDRDRGRVEDPDEGVLYAFEGERGDVVTINVTSTQIDVYVRLANEDGDILVENDDISRNNLNARIEEFELPEDGTYFIAVLGYDSGRYTLEFERVSGGGGGSSQAETDVETIALGDTVRGDAISMDAPVVYTFDGEAGQAVSISLASEEVDVYLVLADRNGDTIAENDDISRRNTDAFVETTLPYSGDYIIGVFAYDPGPFELTLEAGDSSGNQTVEENDNSEGDNFTGSITNREYFVEFPLEGVEEGSTISIDTRATSGDLDLYVGLFLDDEVVAENDDKNRSTTDASLEYPQAAAGDYVVVITRYGFEDGRTTGDFEVNIKVTRGETSVIGIESGGTGGTTEIAEGYPEVPATPNIADWTVLVYMGGDNNLEEFLENDMDEFERAGGSTPEVRVLALFDRSDEYSSANDDWGDTRLFELGEDTSRDSRTNFPATIDTSEIANLGELDTAFAGNLLDFLVWGIKSFPAQNYAIIINDHGGAWTGTVTDETTGEGIISIPDLTRVFDTALKNTGVEKFELLINDACLMSSIEHYAAMARFFDYAIGAPEITLGAGMNMTTLLEALNGDPSIDPADLGRAIVDQYMEDMGNISPDTLPVLGMNVTDLTKFDQVVQAVDAFAEVVMTNRDKYVSFLGEIRSNTYAYTFFVPEDQGGPHFNIDIGHFMVQVAEQSRDEELADAARDVLAALREC